MLKNDLKQQRSIRSKLHCYWLAVRPWSFTASVIPVILGSVLAYNKTKTFNIAVFLSSTFVTLAVHGAGNLVNTYYDYHRGVDSDNADDRTLVDNVLTPDEVVGFGTTLYTTACIAFACTTYFSVARMEVLALIFFGGLSSSFMYTGGIGLKYCAVGDIIIFITFGPLAVLFSYTSQAGRCTLWIIVYAIPLVLITEAILHGNNARDIESDKRSGAVTLAILLGYRGSYMLYVFLLFMPYIIITVMAVSITPIYILPIATIFGAFKLEKQFRLGHMKHLPQATAELNLILGIVYVISCFVSQQV